jgi:hypothetical protein
MLVGNGESFQGKCNVVDKDLVTELPIYIEPWLLLSYDGRRCFYLNFLRDNKPN